MPESIFYQGEPGAFSHRACLRFIEKTGLQAEPSACRTFDDVFARLDESEGSFAVVPFENSTVGLVGPVVDVLWSSQVRILSSTILPVHHHLIALENAYLNLLREVHSHPVALAQCRRFFQLHGGIKAVPAFDTAGAVSEMIERNDSRYAAIAGEDAVVPGTKVLQSNIEDYFCNSTRFLLITKSGREWKCPHHEDPECALIQINIEDLSMDLIAILNEVRKHSGPCSRLITHPIPEPPFAFRLFYEAALCAGATAVLIPAGNLLGRFCFH